MISAVSATSDTNTTSLSSELIDTQITHTDTNTQMDRTNSNNENIKNENEKSKINYTRKSQTNDVLKSENTDKLKSSATKNEDTIKETKTFTDLKNNITTSDTSITLYNNYEFREDSDSELKNGIIIDKIFTIYGNGKTINANNCARIFNVTTEGSLTLINLTIINVNGKLIGAIYNNGKLTITNSTLTNNTAAYGGAIYNKGNLTITNSTLTNNTVTEDGGSIYNRGNLTITNSTLTNNTAAYGGAIYQYEGPLNIADSQFTNTTASNHGGAIYIHHGHMNITDSKFINNTAYSCGGAIYQYEGPLNIADSQFTNTTASNHGGAIYIHHGHMNITDSKFINNTAYSCGGAIAYENDADFDTISNIQRVQIINATSIDDAGGAIYLKHTTINMDDVNITSSKAIFGGAITSLKTNLKINHTHIINSTAEYYGGAIYQMYSNLYITNSNLLNNNALNGGAFYIVLNENLKITDNKFNNNHANNKGNAIYLLLNQTTQIKDNIYNNQTNPMLNDLYETSDVSGFIGNSNYTLYHINYTELPETYPEHYDLRELNLTTPVKNQKYGGNCWAFAAIGALESAILKAGGESLDLSEENLKNLMALYSIYGWNMETNIDGGHYLMASAYFTSWLGPVYEYEDLYKDSSTLSPILNSMTHIQNIVYITRNNNEDNDIIKEALMKYGALGTNMHMDNQYPYLTEDETSYYYDGDEAIDHAVVIVGWDDKYSKYNFEKTPPSDGAWIVKNSWGTEWGENGYFYVSYYDTSFAIRDPNYAIILNDTIKYDKNYQYDIQGITSNFLSSSSTAWYKNVFNSTDNEYLAAVSTYFNEDTDWELTIKVNDIIKGIQTGFCKEGYYTINLNQLIPLNIGDIFEVIFKITVDGTAGILTCEGQNLNVRFYKENISFVSYDGLNWTDLYDLEYNDYGYSPQVACIKAFTILNPVNTILNLDIQNVTESTVDLIATVYNEYGYLVDSGNVTFTIGDKKETVAVQKGIAKLNTLITSREVSAKFEAIGYNTSTNSKIIDTFVPTKMELNKSPISAYISDLEGKAINSGFVVFSDGFENYTVDVVNGFANLTKIFLKIGETQINATYQDPSNYYKTSNNTITITLNKTSFRYLNQQIQNAINNNQNNISLVWDYKYDNETDYEFIKGITLNNKFTIYGNKHIIDGDKKARIFKVTPNGDLTIDNITLIKGMGQDESGDNGITNVGGAIYGDIDSQIIIINTIFTNNTATTYGGAIFTEDNSTLTITNTLFTNNTATGNDSVGGAITADTSKVNIINTVFNNNTANLAAGAIYSNSQVNISQSEFNNNNAHNGGTIYVIYTNINISNSRFTNNNATQGGAIFTYMSTININNATFRQNTAITKGGAIVASNNNLTITNSILQNNNASKGSGIYIVNGTLTTANNKIINNTIAGENYTTKHKDSKLKIETIPDNEGKILTIKITADPLFNDNVTLNINGNNYPVKIINGKGQISIPNLKPGTYTAKLIFPGNENYTEINITSNNFKVNTKPTPTPTPIGKQNTKILAKNKVYKPTKYKKYTVTVKNKKGKLVKNTHVKLRISKKTYTSKTNKKGIATFKIPNKKSKSYKITATLNKNAKKYKLTLKTETQTKKATTNTKGKATFKIKTNTKKIIRKYTITLKTTNNQIIKKQKVTLQINKKTYTTKTNKKGKATFKINNLNKKGKYTATITYKGNNKYNKSNKTTKITIKE